MKMLIGTIAICLGWLCSFGALAEENGGGCTFDVPLPPDPLPDGFDWTPLAQYWCNQLANCGFPTDSASCVSDYLQQINSPIVDPGSPPPDESLDDTPDDSSTLACEDSEESRAGAYDCVSGALCLTMTTCKFNRPGTGCEFTECPAIHLLLGGPRVIHVHDIGFSNPFQCGGDVLFDAQGDLSFPVGGDWIIYQQLPFCPASAYSTGFLIGACAPFCGGPYVCANPNPDCDGADGPLAPAMAMPALK